MYIPQKPLPLNFNSQMIRRLSDADLPPPLQQQMMVADGEEPEAKAPKKRAETWVQDETRALIAMRREMDGLFNTSKSNKHLWEQISAKMRGKGFDRSATMCTDKWRNLLKEFKKGRLQEQGGLGAGAGAVKVGYYKEIGEILREREKSLKGLCGSNKVDSYMQFSDKGIDDASISFGPVEDITLMKQRSMKSLMKAANGRPTLNLERRLDNDGPSLAITAADAVAANGVSPWNWRDTPGNGADSNSYGGRVITVKWGNYSRRIGISGSTDAIKEAIRAAFGLRTRRAFWVEDEDRTVWSFNRDMPLGNNYTLHIDGGMTVKVCVYDESNQIPVHTEEKVFYNEDDYREFLNRRGWTSLREFDSYRNIDNMDDLRPGVLYCGVN